MRVFVSVNLPDAVKQELQVAQSRLRSKCKNIRWTAPENMHITLQFIGDYPEKTLHIIHEAMNPIMESTKGFDIELGGFGTFPPQGNPAVLWVGVRNGSPFLTALADQVSQALVDAEIPVNAKPFVPHVTLGRRKRSKPAFVPETIQLPLQNTCFPVQSLYLMESQLQPQGPVYFERLVFDLKG